MTTVVPAHIGLLVTGLTQHLTGTVSGLWPVAQHWRTPSSPRRCVLMQAAWITDDPATGLTEYDLTVQLRDDTTAGTAPILGMSQAIRDALVSLRQTVLTNGIPITDAWRERGNGLGPGADGLTEWADAYLIRSNTTALT